MEARLASTSEKAGKDELNRLLADLARLQLKADYEELAREREELMVSERSLRLDLSRLQEREASVSQGRDDLLRAKEAIKQERENAKMD